MRKPIEKIKVTTELKEHYRKVGEFLKANPMIESKKLVLGYQVSVNTIPDSLVNDWLKISTFNN